jgi:hypothetical protein
MKLKNNLAISESGFMFDPESGDSYTLNFSGKEIVQLIKQGMSMEQIKATMLEKYEVDRDTLERNLFDFMSMLNHYQMLQENGEN